MRCSARWRVRRGCAMTTRNARRETVQRLIDQHGTVPYMGYKSELKGL